MPSDNKFMNLVYIYNITYYFFLFYAWRHEAFD